MVIIRILEVIFRNYRVNYLTEYDLYIDIVIIVYTLGAKIHFEWLIREDCKK